MSALLTLMAVLSVVPPAGDTVDLEVFTREGCPHCAAAHTYLDKLTAERPELRVSYRVIDRDKQARDDLELVSAACGITTPGVPTFHLNGKAIVGFLDEERSAPRLLAFINGGSPQRPAAEGACEAPEDCAQPPPAAAEEACDTGVSDLPAAVTLPVIGDVTLGAVGLPVFTLAIGLLDGFNPCAMWVLLFLLAMLVNLKDRRRMAMIAGTFVIVSGAMYFAFMAAWLNVFMIMGMSDPVRYGLGLVALGVGLLNVKDFFAFKQGPSLSIPEAAKPGLYQRMRDVISAKNLTGAMLAVAVLAVAVNFVELLCTAGLPAMYTAVLSGQDLTGAERYGYLGLYNLAYVFDDSLMVGIAVATLGRRKLQEKEGRWLKLIGGTVMLGLAFGLLFFPELLF